MVSKGADQRGSRVGLPQGSVKLDSDSEGASSWRAKASERPVAQGELPLRERKGKEETNKFAQATEVWQPDFLCCAVGVFVEY